MAGYVGVDPSNFKLWQIVSMYRGKQKAEWIHTSSLVSMIYNTKAKKGKAPKDFYPKGL
jgi:hypothetical protein